MKWFRYAVEAFFTIIALSVFRLLPMDLVSGWGAWFMRYVGPRTKVHRVAVNNINTVMSELSDEEKKQALISMWENIGRTFCEYPHLATKTMKKRITLAQGKDIIETCMTSGKSTIFVSGHFGNWEIVPLAADLFHRRSHVLYRPANNPIVEWLMSNTRRQYTHGLYKKGVAGARALLKAIRNKEDVGVLIDQKTNDGIESLFFDRPAMTSTAVAHIMLHRDVNVVPCHCIRRNGAHFDVYVDAPVTYSPTGDEKQDIANITQMLNDIIEGWVREHPGQWFWVHKRWLFSKRGS